jgi:ribose/xylose/arabinose/galactoside ABC-type transport system permease subunit
MDQRTKKKQAILLAMDAYLEALLDKKPENVPVSPQLKMTNNGEATAIGETLMDAIAAVVLGGASLSGGKASIFGTFVGVVLLGSISNGLTLLGITSFTQLVGKGAIPLLAVFVDVMKNQGQRD